jgi:endonuclease/exonuclease/phosphatase family metal-dependent hydrolase
VKWSDRTTYQGKAVNQGTLAILKAANTILQNSPHYGREKSNVTMVQGGYNRGGVAASAGTHDGGGAFDITAFNWKNRVKVFRLLGMAIWRRPTIRGLWSEHIHGIVCGDGTASRGAKGQVTEFYNGGDGLQGSAKDPDWRPKALPILFVAPWDSRGKPGVYYLTKDQTMRDQPSTKGTSRGKVAKGAKFTVVAILNVKGTLWAVNTHGNFVVKSALTTKAPSKPKPTPTPKPTPKPPAHDSLRIGTLNFPDGSKIAGSEDARIERMIDVIGPAALDVICFQEMVGRQDDDPSEFAAKVDAAAGSDWVLVTPTLGLNENYFLYHKNRVGFVEQHDDVVIRGTVAGKAIGGRHVSRLTLEHDGIGEFDLGNTHLINDNRPGAEVQAGLAASALAKIGTNRPRILLGDMNTSGPLSALASAGLHNARLIAAATTNRDMATYAKYSAKKPSVDMAWIIDQVWVSNHFTVAGYTVMPDLASNGEFKKPRVSDHLPVIVALNKK